MQMNKKALGALAVAAIMMTASVAMAGNITEDVNTGKHRRDFYEETMPERSSGIPHRWFRDADNTKHDDKHPEISEHKFVVFGEVRSTSSSVMVVHTNDVGDGRKGSRNVGENENVTIRLNSDTKFHLKGGEADSGDIEDGMKVMVTGRKDGDTLTAKRVRVMSDKKAVYGEVTAVSDDSVTIKDARTGETQTISLDSGAKVVVNGDKSSIDEIEVGDKGFVKVKSILGDIWGKVVRIFRK